MLKFMNISRNEPALLGMDFGRILLIESHATLYLSKDMTCDLYFYQSKIRGFYMSYSCDFCCTMEMPNFYK